MKIADSLVAITTIVVVFAAICYATILLKRGTVWVFRRVSGADVRDQMAREAERRRYRNPDWQFFREHLKRPVPHALVELYSTDDLSTWGMIRLRDREAHLSAIDSRSISSGTAELLGHEVVPLGFDDCGQVIYLKPGTDAPDVVYVYDAEEECVLFESIEAYVETVQANR